MEIKELNYIVAIAEEGSISRAAERLFMAQSSLSQLLTLFEADHGFRLFFRTARGVRPTASGEVFLNHARQMLLQYHRTKNEMWDIEQLHGGQIEFGVSSFRGTYLMPRILKEFRQKYPKVVLKVTELDSLKLEDIILEGALDLAMVALPAEKLTSNLEFLLRDEILLVAHRSHPIMEYVHQEDVTHGRPWVRLEDAARFEFIFGHPKTMLGTIVRREFQKRGLPPITWNTSFSAGFAAAMAREGVSLALTYRSCVVKDDNVEYLRIDKEGVYMDLGLAYPAGEYRSKATRALAQMIRDSLSTVD